MTLQDETILECFKSGDRSRVKKWLNSACGQLWSIEEWTFRYAEDDITVTAGSSTVTGLAADMLIPVGVWNSEGERLRSVTAVAWNTMYYGQTGQGRPETYSVLNGAVRVGPISDETSSTYRMLYERAYGHLNAGTTWTAGDMVEDTDEPVFPDETHYTLVHWARTIGKSLRSDPTAALDSQLRDEGIEAMRRSFLAETRGEYQQWGAYDPELDAYGSLI